MSENCFGCGQASEKCYCHLMGRGDEARRPEAIPIDRDLPGLLRALASDCANTDGWEGAVVTLIDAAARLDRLSMPLDFARSNTRAGERAPIDMLLFCPKCGVQHIDRAEEPRRLPNGNVAHGCEMCDGEDQCTCPGRAPRWWTNPPHRSHLCHACGCIWRPADIATNGVAAIATKGGADTWTVERSPADLEARARELLEKIQFLATNHGGWLESDPPKLLGEIHRLATDALALKGTPK